MLLEQTEEEIKLQPENFTDYLRDAPARLQNMYVKGCSLHFR